MAKTLVTLDEYKLFAGIVSEEYDDKLTGIIKRVSELVKTYCDRTFIDSYDKTTSTYSNIVEYTNNSGYYYTKEFPVHELVSVEYSADYGATYTAYTEAVLDKSSDAILLYGADVSQANAFKITYKAGYDKTPEDLKLACLDLVEYYYKEQSTTRKSSGSTALEYITTENLPSHIKRILDLYRALR